MSLNITVNGKIQKHCGRASILDDPEQKQKELFAERRLQRIQQVREQSKEIARKIRCGVAQDKERQLRQLDEIKAREFQAWQTRALAKVENDYRTCMTQVGSAHCAAHRENEQRAANEAAKQKRRICANAENYQNKANKMPLRPCLKNKATCTQPATTGSTCNHKAQHARVSIQESMCHCCPCNVDSDDGSESSSDLFQDDSCEVSSASSSRDSDCKGQQKRDSITQKTSQLKKTPAVVLEVDMECDDILTIEAPGEIKDNFTENNRQFSRVIRVSPQGIKRSKGNDPCRFKVAQPTSASSSAETVTSKTSKGPSSKAATSTATSSESKTSTTTSSTSTATSSSAATMTTTSSDDQPKPGSKKRFTQVSDLIEKKRASDSGHKKQKSPSRASGSFNDPSAKKVSDAVSSSHKLAENSKIKHVEAAERRSRSPSPAKSPAKAQKSPHKNLQPTKPAEKITKSNDVVDKQRSSSGNKTVPKKLATNVSKVTNSNKPMAKSQRPANAIRSQQPTLQPLGASRDAPTVSRGSKPALRASRTSRDAATGMRSRPESKSPRTSRDAATQIELGKSPASRPVSPSPVRSIRTRSQSPKKPLKQKEPDAISVQRSTATFGSATGTISGGSSSERVQYYDYNNKFTKAYPQPVNAVRLSARNPAQPNAMEQARMEEQLRGTREQETEQLRRRSEERGKKAIEREQVRRDCLELTEKLDALSKQHHNLLPTDTNIKASHHYADMAARKESKMNTIMEEILMRPAIITCPEVKRCKPIPVCTDTMSRAKLTRTAVAGSLNLGEPPDRNICNDANSNSSDSCRSILLGYVNDQGKQIANDINQYQSNPQRNQDKSERLKNLLERIDQLREALQAELEAGVANNDANSVQEVIESISNVRKERERILIDGIEQQTLMPLKEREKELIEKEQLLNKKVKDLKKSSNEAVRKLCANKPLEIIIRVAGGHRRKSSKGRKSNQTARKSKSPRESPRRTVAQKQITAANRHTESIAETVPEPGSEQELEQEFEQELEQEFEEEPSTATRQDSSPENSANLMATSETTLQPTQMTVQDSYDSNSTAYRSLPATIGNNVDTVVDNLQTQAKQAAMTSDQRQSKQLKVIKEPASTTPRVNPLLAHYVQRLLGMSRNSIKTLGVSTSDIDTPSSSIMDTTANQIMDSEEDQFSRQRLERVQAFVDENHNLINELEETLRASSNSNNSVESSMRAFEEIWKQTLSDNDKRKRARQQTVGQSAATTARKAQTAKTASGQAPSTSAAAAARQAPSTSAAAAAAARKAQSNKPKAIETRTQNLKESAKNKFDQEKSKANLKRPLKADANKKRDSLAEQHANNMRYNFPTQQETKVQNFTSNLRRNIPIEEERQHQLYNYADEVQQSQQNRQNYTETMQLYFPTQVAEVQPQSQPQPTLAHSSDNENQVKSTKSYVISTGDQNQVVSTKSYVIISNKNNQNNISGTRPQEQQEMPISPTDELDEENAISPSRIKPRSDVDKFKIIEMQKQKESLRNVLVEKHQHRQLAKSTQSSGDFAENMPLCTQQTSKSKLDDGKPADTAGTQLCVDFKRYAQLTNNCTLRIAELTELINKVRKEKQKILENTLSSVSETERHSTEYLELPSTGAAAASDRSYSEGTTSKILDSNLIDQHYTTDETSRNDTTTMPLEKHKSTGKSHDSGISVSRPQTAQEQNQDMEPASVASTTTTTTSMRKPKPPPSLSRYSPQLLEDELGHELSTILEVDTPATSRLNASLIPNQSATSDLQSAYLQSSFPTFEQYVQQLHLDLKQVDSEQGMRIKQEFDELIAALIEARNNRDLDWVEFPSLTTYLQNIASSHENVQKPFAVTSPETIEDLLACLRMANLTIKSFPSHSEYMQRLTTNTPERDIHDTASLENFTTDGAVAGDQTTESESLNIEEELKRRNILQSSFRRMELTQRDEIFNSTAHHGPEKKDDYAQMLSAESGIEKLSSSDNHSIDLEKEFLGFGINWHTSMLRKMKETQALSSSSTTTTSATLHLSGNKAPSAKNAPPATNSNSDSPASLLQKSDDSTNDFVRPLNLRDFLTKELLKHNKTSASESTSDESLRNHFLRSIIGEITPTITPCKQNMGASSNADRQKTSTPVASQVGGTRSGSPGAGNTSTVSTSTQLFSGESRLSSVHFQ